MLLTLLMTLAVGAAPAQADPVLAILEAFHEDRQFDGAALVYQSGEQTIREGFGIADQETGTANTPETRFDIASITKAFTGTLALQLVQDGKWTLDSPIGKYLTEIESDQIRAITLRQLLEHKSGIGRDHTEYFPSSRQDLGFEDLIHVLNTSPLLFEPGSRSSYSNSGYVLLRYALERVTKKDYSQLLTQRILKPLGMKSTGLLTTAKPSPDLAQGYSTWLITEPSPGRRRLGATGDLLGAGGLYSTVDDLWRFVQGIEDRKILNDESVALLWPAEDPGLGWEILQLPGTDDEPIRAILTTGASPLGFLSGLVWLPSENSGYVILSNTEAPGRTGFPSLLIQLGGALQGATAPVEVPATPIRDVLNALFVDGLDAALEIYRKLERPASTRARADAAQAAGAPNAPPGETSLAWASLTPNDRPEWLELWYEPPIEATEIHVYETQIPGAITRVELRSPDNQKTRIETLAMTQTVAENGVPVSVIPLPLGPSIEYLTLHFDAAGVPGWTQIDAVGLLHGPVDLHWATGARASSSAATGTPPPIHAYPSAHVLELVARSYKEAGRRQEAQLILAFMARVKEEPAP